MTFIKSVRRNGTCLQTQDRVGTTAEEKYFTVMTERFGKLFFDSRDGYNRWCDEGRKQNEASGCFTNARHYFDSSFTGTGTGADELMIVEAYHVEDAVDGSA